MDGHGSIAIPPIIPLTNLSKLHSIIVETKSRSKKHTALSTDTQRCTLLPSEAMNLQYGCSSRWELISKPDVYIDGQTPLHKAAESGHMSVVKLLCDNGANLEAQDGWARPPLHCIREPVIVRLLL